TNSFFHSTDPREHSFLRKRVSATYSMTSILSLEPRIQQVADTMWSRFGDFGRSGEAIDLDKWASFFAFDVVGELALGGPMGFVESGADPEGIIAAIHGFFFFGANMGYLPFQSRIIQNPVTQAMAGKIDAKATGASYFNAWLAQQIGRRRARGPPKAGEKADMLDHFIAMKTPSGGPAEDKDVLVEMGNIVGAGADTTSIGIRTVLGQLLLNPSSYVRAQQEIDQAYAAHGFSDEPGVGNITFAVASELPFLAACVKEALRLHPSILWQLPREVPAQGLHVKGYYIPSSATVSISPISQNRCPEVYGPDADAWRPERWIVGEGSTEQQVREMTKFDTTFGYGSRTCVGKHLALVEIHKFVAQMLHQFDVELVNKERPWVTHSMWFSYQAEMLVKVKERERRA
ncbi:cytochrome P450, partial [Macrophomina phaseolina]